MTAMKTTLHFVTSRHFFCRINAGAPGRPPNILFIMSDDHAWQAISAYSESRHLIQTPNIDRLAREGMRFDRCLVNNSLCGPSRASIITGTYSHINGFYNNANCRFDGSQITFPKLLQKAGYQTAMIGKWHLETDPTGFDHWEILAGPGHLLQSADDPRRQAREASGLCHRHHHRPFAGLAETARSEQAVHAAVLEKAPHRNWQPALSDLDFDHDRTYPLPDSLFDDYSGRGLAEHDQNMTIVKTMQLVMTTSSPPRRIFRRNRKKSGMPITIRATRRFRKMNLTGRALTEWKYNRFMHDYLGCIKGVDDNVGRILKYLDDTGLATNTIVIYSSDQGFFLGEHGWFDKRWIFQESARTPLLIRWPGVIKPGSVNKDLVANLDFAETFLQAAGLPIPDRMQGRSLMPLLQGRRPPTGARRFIIITTNIPPTTMCVRITASSPTATRWRIFTAIPDRGLLGTVRPRKRSRRNEQRFWRSSLRGRANQSDAGSFPSAKPIEGAGQG